MADISMCPGKRSISRILPPMTVPPGSKVRTTSWPSSANRSERSRACVVLPVPSIPSRERKKPFFNDDRSYHCFFQPHKQLAYLCGFPDASGSCAARGGNKNILLYQPGRQVLAQFI